MHVIATQRDPSGTYRDVGTNYRGLIGPFKTWRGAHNAGVRYSSGKPCRIEYFGSPDAVRRNDPPLRTEYINQGA
jgi:hypothetical protein